MAKIAIVLNASWNIYNFRLPLLKHLNNAGHEIIAIAPEDEYTSKIPFEFHPVKMKSRSLNPFRHLVVLLDLIRTFRKVKPDIALLYTIQPNIHGNIAARLTGTATISNIAGLGHLFVHRTAATRFANQLYKFALRHASKVFFQNGEDMRVFIKFELVVEEKASRIPGSGVDTERFASVPKLKNDINRPFVFLLAARMLWEKGIAEFAQAAKLVSKNHDNVIFRLVGPLDADNPSALGQSDMDELTTGGVLEYAGVSDHMEDVIAAADCVVLPTFYREGLPKTLLEATAMAKPIITTRMPGCTDAVEDGVNGFLCESQDAENLARKMEMILALSESAREVMGREGRRKAELEFDQRIVFAAYQKAVHAILEEDYY